MSETWKKSPKPMVGPAGEIKYETIRQYQVFLWRLTVGMAGILSMLALAVGSWTVSQVVSANKEINELKLTTATRLGDMNARVAVIENTRFKSEDGYAMKEELRREMREIRSLIPQHTPRPGP